MSEGISIEVGSLFPYVEAKIAALFGRDYATLQAGERLNRQLRIAARVASTVQIVGMDRPISIEDIYQPTRITRQWRAEQKELMFADILRLGWNTVIYGGPGTGKTVFLHHIFSQLSRSGDDVPVLFTLRWSDAVNDLTRFVKDLAARRLRRLRDVRLLILVDGYDEIGAGDRLKVARALREYSTLEIGNYYLTCRTFYDTDEIEGHRVEIVPFSRADARMFITAFARAYGVDLNANTLLTELEERGFASYAEHPLMLALACILRSGPLPSLPRTAIGLIRRAISTLTLRWDQSKGVHRESRVAIDGDDRVRCMMRIAFELTDFYISEQKVRAITRQFLKLLQKMDVDTHQFLTEIAQWYGMLIPVSEGKWTFVHRTIHDFLAAQYWVESGQFQPDKVVQWTSRAAYAACLLPDATSSMVHALSKESELNAFTECLYNGALFDGPTVAGAVVDHLERFSAYKQVVSSDEIVVETSQDFYALVSNEFLEDLIQAGLAFQTPAREVVLAYSLAEFVHRQNRMRILLLRRIGERYREISFTVVRMAGSVVLNFHDIEQSGA